MGQARNWSDEEIDYLQDKWGMVSILGIANHLCRSVEAIKLKANRIGLGRHLHSGDYITLNHLMQAIRGRPVNSYDEISFIKNRGLPVKYKKVINKKFRIIYIQDFWQWAEQNSTFIDFSKFEENALGEEPSWVKKQRKLDYIKSINFKSTPWTGAEDEKLRFLLKQFKYSCSEISTMLCRTEGAVKRRMVDLKLRERPIKADNHIAWTDAETDELLSLIEQGYSWELIAQRIGKSAQACRGKHERLQNPTYMRDYWRKRHEQEKEDKNNKLEAV